MQTAHVNYIMALPSGLALLSHSVDVDATSTIADFRFALKADEPITFADVEPTEIAVFANRDAYHKREAFADVEPIGSHGKTLRNSVVVVTPTARMNQSSFCVAAGVVEHALDRPGVRERMHELAMIHVGYYDPERPLRYPGQQVEKVAFWHEGTSLIFHVFFRHRDTHALEFETALRCEPRSVGSPLFGLRTCFDVTGVHRECLPYAAYRRIFIDDYFAEDSISPPPSLTPTTVIAGDEEFQYQRIEAEAVFGSFRMAESVRVMSKEDCESHREFRAFSHDSSNRLAMSRELCGFYNGVNLPIPVVNIHIGEVDPTPNADGRYKVELRVISWDETYAALIFKRLKEDASPTSDRLVRTTSVYVLDPVVFRTCVTWKANIIDKEWEGYLDLAAPGE